MAENGKGDFTRRLAQKALMPIVATAASAAAGYAAKKGPQLFEEKVLPLLKEADVSSRAKSAVGSVGDVAQDLTQKAKDTVPGTSSTESSTPSTVRRNGGLSQNDLERHVKARSEARAARRKTTTRS
jgi:hypothetical protein